MTVEETLKELKKMFPNWHCEVSTTCYLGETTDRLYIRVDIHCTDFKQNDWTESGATIEVAMDRVRRFNK